MPETLNNNAPMERMMRRHEVERVTGLSRTTIYEGMNAGTFPRAVKLGKTAVAWPESVIQRWIQDRIASAPI